jgi:3-methyladenine DNA glycosylase AlkC
MKELIGPDLITMLGARISAVAPAFPIERFCADLHPILPPLALKQRVAAVAHALRQTLPADYPTALAIIVAALGPVPAEGPGMFDDGWYAWPLATFVEQYGLAHPHESLAALHAITQRNTAEFAIRPFLAHHTELTLHTLHTWVRDPSFHVRRLVSEGTRPRLPWATQLPPFIADPTPVLALLESLRDDPSAYVRRSVANNLNDIAKDHPTQVLTIAQRWLHAAPPERERLVRHALRTLIKQGHPAALGLLGADPRAAVVLEQLDAAPTNLPIGATCELRATLRSTAATTQRLVIDYAVQFASVHGTLRRKVFKLRTSELAPGAALAITWNHSFRQLSTRRHYPGAHVIELQVNGIIVGQVNITLSE